MLIGDLFLLKFLFRSHFLFTIEFCILLCFFKIRFLSAIKCLYAFFLLKSMSFNFSDNFCHCEDIFHFDVILFAYFCFCFLGYDFVSLKILLNPILYSVFLNIFYSFWFNIQIFFINFDLKNLILIDLTIYFWSTQTQNSNLPNSPFQGRNKQKRNSFPIILVSSYTGKDSLQTKKLSFTVAWKV